MNPYRSPVCQSFCLLTLSMLVVPLTEAAGRLNDTGVVSCSNGGTNGLRCPAKDYVGQDAQFGRDVVANNNADGRAGFSFTKVSRNGSELAASARAWNCVKDNVTGLMWEVKTDDGGLHDKDWAYSWYEPDNSKNGGNAGIQNGGNCGNTSVCDTSAYVQSVNAAGWCGANDWRLPTPAELHSLVSYDLSDFLIDPNYFPNTQSSIYWTSASVLEVDTGVWDGGILAWYVSFYSGKIEKYPKNIGFPLIRLVRSGQ